MEAANARNCQLTVVDPLHCQFIFDAGSVKLLHPRYQMSAFDSVIPRFGPIWQRQGGNVLAHLQTHSIPSLNSASALALVRDKAGCLRAINAHGVPIPKSASIESLEHAKQFIPMHFDFPLLIKQNSSAQGRGVELMVDLASALTRMEQLFELNEPFLIQEYIHEACGIDLRLFVADQNVIACMQRTAASGDFRANVHQGGSAVACEATAEETALAIKVAKLTGLDVAGVDMLRSKCGPLVLEINACPGFEALERVTGVDIAGKMLDLLICKQKPEISGE